MKVIALYQVECCCFLPQGCCYFHQKSIVSSEMGTVVNTHEKKKEKKTLCSTQGDVLEKYVTPQKLPIERDSVTLRKFTAFK